MNVKEVLYEFVKTKFEIGDDPDYSMDAHLFDLGFVDSLGATEIIIFAEETFGIEISQKDILMNDMNTISEIAAVIESKL